MNTNNNNNNQSITTDDNNNNNTTTDEFITDLPNKTTTNNPIIERQLFDLLAKRSMAMIKGELPSTPEERKVLTEMSEQTLKYSAIGGLLAGLTSNILTSPLKRLGATGRLIRYPLFLFAFAAGTNMGAVYTANRYIPKLMMIDNSQFADDLFKIMKIIRPNSDLIRRVKEKKRAAAAVSTAKGIIGDDGFNVDSGSGSGGDGNLLSTPITNSNDFDMSDPLLYNNSSSSSSFKDRRSFDNSKPNMNQQQQQQRKNLSSQSSIVNDEGMDDFFASTAADPVVSSSNNNNVTRKSSSQQQQQQRSSSPSSPPSNSHGVKTWEDIRRERGTN
jgi:hypothetical protein